MQAFEGDRYIEQEIRGLVKRWKVQTIVETGTYEGASTRAFADMDCHVITIEISPKPIEWGDLINVQAIEGDSGEILGEVLEMLRKTRPLLLYLDAHWKEHSPLLDELKGIAKANLKKKPIIAIHDFFNPAHPEYGFDTWDIGAYRFELIHPYLKEIYPGGFIHWYNDKAEGLQRGIIYVEPKL